MIYTESYETRKGYSEVAVNDNGYVIDYIIKSPIDGKASEVNGTFSLIEGDNKTRIGYGSYMNGASSVRFDASANIAFDVQIALNEQFMTDLEEILK